MSLLKDSAIVLVGRGSGFLVQFISSVILARLLTPDEFGVFSVAAGAAAALYALREFGSSNYLVRAPAVDRATVGSVLLVSFALAGILGGALAVFSPWIAGFFGDGRIEPLLYVIAANFLLAPFSMLGNALLVREGRFMEQTGANVAAALAGSVVMISLALGGAGPLALAVGTTASTLIFVVLAARARPKGYTLCLSFTHVPKVLRFGGWLTGVGIVNQFSQRLGELVIGRVLGLASAGLFDKGGALVRLFSSFASPVIHSVVFARVAEESRQGEDMRAGYFHRLAIIAAVSWPAFLFLALEAGPMIRLVFGPQWDGAVPVAFWLSVQAMLSTPFLLADQLLITRGHVAALFWQKVTHLFARLVVLIAVSGFGLAAVSAALLLPALLYLWLNQRSVLKLVGAGWRDLLLTLWRPALLTALAASVATSVARSYVGIDWIGVVLELGFSAGAASIAWMAAAVVLRGPASDLSRQILRAGWLRIGNLWRQTRPAASCRESQ